MQFWEIFLLSCALAADAFSVGASVGLSHRHRRQLFRLSFHFGLFQSLFSFMGLLLGATILVYIEAVDHWVACILLSYIGGMMIYKSFKSEQEDVKEIDLTKGMQLMMLSMAVSIDAFAAGVGLPAAHAPAVLTISMIGIITSVATLLAMLLANYVKEWVGKRIEIIAGLVLIILGIKVLIDHRLFN